MKIIQNTAQDLTESILSNDPQRQNRALKSLYMNPMVNAKVKDWAKLYNLRDKMPDDVLQEAMVLLYDMVLDGRFRGASKVETFLLGICKNLIRDSVKKVSRVQWKDSFTDAELRSEDEAADQILLVEQAEGERHRDDELGKAIGQLTANCQDSLKLYYYHNKSMTEIAEARQLANAEQAKKAVHRCRESLRNLISANAGLQHVLNPRP